MRGRLLKVLMVVLVLVPVGLTAYLANNLYHRKGVPEALENLTKQLFRSKQDELKAQERAAQLAHKADELQTAYDSLVADLRGEVDSKDIRVRQFREKLEINFVDKVLFASGSADITPRGHEILLKVGKVLAKLKDKSIYVVGHTDSNPIHSGLYPSNWELSTARASSVIRFLSETGGVSPERFTAMGRAFYQPVASNATPEGRQENRRVDIIVAEVPLLAGETGSESMRGTVSGSSPEGSDLTSQPAPIRETAPAPAQEPAAPTTPQVAPAPPAPAVSGTMPPATPNPAPTATPETTPATVPETAPAAAPGAPPTGTSEAAPAGTPNAAPAQAPSATPPTGESAKSGESAKPGTTTPASPPAKSPPAVSAQPPAGPALPPALPDRPGPASGKTGS